jgi:uncharacterized membrane protein YgcG
MKTYYILLGFLFCSSLAFAQERILSYHSAISVEKTGSVLVREDITVQAEGNAIRRGIYRSFPTKYSDKLGTRFKVGFTVVEVLRDGNPEPWHTEEKSNGIIVYIGSPDTELTSGIYRYTLTYRTTRQVGFFKDFDELYFNAIGGDWIFPIESAGVSVTLPKGAEIIHNAAWSGPAGSETCQCNISAWGSTFTLSTTQPLQPGEQLTFAVAWPKGFVAAPTQAQKMKDFAKGNLHVVLAILGLLTAIYLYYREWKAVGKDPVKGTIIPLFDPPAGFTPAATGYLMKQAMNDRVFTAALVNLAVHGYLKIIHNKKDYTVEKISEDTSKLSPEEESLASALFTGRKEIKLDNKNHQVFQSARQKLDRSLDKILNPKYFKLNTKHMTKGFLASVVFVVLTFLAAPDPSIPVILIFVMVALAILFVYLMKAPTPEGRAIMDEMEGFKMYLSVAEKDQLNLMHEPDLTPERFENLLPYAIALGVENQWGRKFEQALSRSLQESTSYRPAWYAGAGAVAAFSPQKFTSTVGKSFSTAISSASTPPGKSSGSGGGGRSGGGGGGGGGGGW